MENTDTADVGEAPVLETAAIDPSRNGEKTPPLAAPALKCFIAYVASTGTGQVAGNMVLNGIPDIVTEVDLVHIQQQVAEQIKVPAIAITFWKHLYA